MSGVGTGRHPYVKTACVQSKAETPVLKAESYKTSSFNLEVGLDVHVCPCQ